MNDPRIDRLILWQRRVGRAMIVGVVLSGLVWLGAGITLAVFKNQDEEFHRQVVAPAIERSKETTNESDSGELNFENPHEVVGAIDAWIERMERTTPYRRLKFYASMGFCGVMGFGVLSLAIINAKVSRLRASPSRPADEGAGELTKRMAAANETIHAQPSTVPKNHGKTLFMIGWVVVGITACVAAASSADVRWALAITLFFFSLLFGLFWWIDKIRGGDPRTSVVIDVKAGRITFRHFKFVSKFSGNRRSTETVLGIRDILEVSPYSDRNGRAIKIRTTHGTVILFDRLQNFPVVEALLYDFVEINRLDNDAFQDALRREPKITTPWWGWLLLAVLVLGVVGFIWLLLVATV